ncbi:response regulator [Spirosoma taeanense]|uniref:Response regulator n=1 Tax=Spirosoma taeanense TaxID=2735870 RepID=A0A6M5Y7T0_9BACT|nr:response regulator [Spirosoma taeanense]QJW89965.1 response regulator [Spirosoma taeanense]
MPYTILVAEDNEDYFTLYARHVERFFDQVTLIGAQHGGEALEKLQSGLIPNLILVDIKMPVMDGYEFLTRLRATEAWRYIPVIIWTGYTLSRAEVVRFYTAGANSVMSKHDSMKDIKAFCQYWFEMVQIP